MSASFFLLIHRRYPQKRMSICFDILLSLYQLIRAGLQSFDRFPLLILDHRVISQRRSTNY